MSPSPTRDFAVGLFVLAGLAAIAYLSLNVGGVSLRHRGGLILSADFDETGGLTPRAPVTIAGVKVGQVRSVRLSSDFRARVTVNLAAGLKLPVDTSASIVTAGLLGDRYVVLQPGGDDQDLKSGDQIRFTQSAIILERLIGKFIQNAGVQKSE